MKKKNFIIAILSGLRVFTLCACSKTSNEDQVIIDDMVNKFNSIANVPRPSNHEEKIADYLCDWAKSHGFSPVNDIVNNVIFDVPATEGMENKEKVILQCHSDMVFAQTGEDKDPLTTPIEVNNDGQKLTANGTSLGEDDGIGCSIAYVQQKVRFLMDLFV